MTGRQRELIRAVSLLADDFVSQARYLQSLGIPQSVDELALEFDAVAAASDDMHQRGELNDEQHEATNALNSLLDQMSGEGSTEWTLSSLAQSDRWQDVRRRAKELLVLLRQD